MIGDLINRLAHEHEIEEDAAVAQIHGEMPIIHYWRSHMFSFKQALDQCLSMEDQVLVCEKIRACDRAFCSLSDRPLILQQRVLTVAKLVDPKISFNANLLVFWALWSETAMTSLRASGFSITTTEEE